MTQEAKTILCHQCKTNECLDRYPEGMPDYCQAKKFREVVEASKQQYLKPEVANIHLATAKVLKRGGYDWSRIQQSIEFARELNVTKVGLAVCVGLIREGREFARFLSRAGFHVISVACMVGGLEAQETGIPDEPAIRLLCGGLDSTGFSKVSLAPLRTTKPSFICSMVR